MPGSRPVLCFSAPAPSAPRTMRGERAEDRRLSMNTTLPFFVLGASPNRGIFKIFRRLLCFSGNGSGLPRCRARTRFCKRRAERHGEPGFLNPNSGTRIQEPEFRNSNSGVRFQEFGFRSSGSGVRVQEFGFRVLLFKSKARAPRAQYVACAVACRLNSTLLAFRFPCKVYFTFRI